MTIPDPKSNVGDRVIFRWRDDKPEREGEIVQRYRIGDANGDRWVYWVRVEGWANRRKLQEEQILRVMRRAA